MRGDTSDVNVYTARVRLSMNKLDKLKEWSPTVIYVILLPTALLLLDYYEGVSEFLTP